VVRSGKFQFHAGSIKGGRSPPSALSPLAGFNSTLVRLKGSYRSHRPGSVAGSFNSTLVRLKGVFYHRTLRADYLFQFHAGSIKGGAALTTYERGVGCFNSTLVRLKGVHLGPLLLQVRRFQFHAGSIKGFDMSSLQLFYPYVSIPRWFD